MIDENFFDINKNNYLYLFSDCFLVKGHTRTMICDVSRKKMFFINNPYYDVLLELKHTKIGEFVSSLEGEDDLKEFEKFIIHLLNNELVVVVSDIERFPPIEIQWDSPYKVANAIIDIREKEQPFKKIFQQLDNLLCPQIQIRSYVYLTPEKIEAILKSYNEIANFRHIQILLAYNESIDVNELKALTNKFYMISLVIHSVSENKIDELNKQRNSYITFIEQTIDSCNSCGIINKNSLGLSTLEYFIENIKYNGCLNRKISIDENGEIKNCPSITTSYGNINDESLEKVIEFSSFRKLWDINKDNIKTCQDCEYRYVCTDCRAYLEDQNDIYSKPLKCSYDPYTGQWAN